LGVDLIVRGRIIEYGYKGIDTYNPLKRGFLPILIEPMKDVLFGAADQKTYESGLEDIDYKERGAYNDFILDRKREEEDFSRLGEVPGFLFGQKTEDDLEGTWDLMMEHSFGTLSNLHPRKKSVSTIVQIRMYAQDPRTGDVLWSNRAETEYVPTAGVSFNQRYPKTMFDENIKKCVKLLMDDLFSVVSQIEKIIELRESAASETKTPLSDIEESRARGLEDRMSENKVLKQELRAKIENLENSKRILLQQIEDKTLITLPNAILFSSGYATLTQQGIRTLKTIGEVLGRYPNRDICIEGHTDSVPIGPKIKDKYVTNWELSTARAISVKNYMVKSFKLDQSRVAVKGYGPFKPVASNNTPEGKAKNRRVVIVVGSRT
jgi:chemotaxis protein MotB